MLKFEKKHSLISHLHRPLSAFFIKHIVLPTSDLNRRGPEGWLRSWRLDNTPIFLTLKRPSKGREPHHKPILKAHMLLITMYTYLKKISTLSTRIAFLNLPNPQPNLILNLTLWILYQKRGVKHLLEEIKEARKLHLNLEMLMLEYRLPTSYQLIMSTDA